MHVHILGICGTFMGGIAAIAKAAGHRVTGSDKNVYPPMSTQLEALGIELISGFDASQLTPKPDVVVVGNVMTRGVPVIEALLESRIPYTSGPEWLAREVLRDVHVLGVSGTHGKTTTSSMLALFLMVWLVVIFVRIVRAAFEWSWPAALLLVIGQEIFSLLVFVLIFGAPAGAT